MDVAKVCSEAERKETAMRRALKKALEIYRNAELHVERFIDEAKAEVVKAAEQFEEDPVEFVCELDGVTPYSLEDCVRNGTDLLQAVPFNKFLKKHTSSQWRDKWKMVVNSLLSEMSEAEFNVQTAYSVLGFGIDGVSLSKMERMLWMVHWLNELQTSDLYGGCSRRGFPRRGRLP